MRKSIFIALLVAGVCASGRAATKNGEAAEVKKNSVERFFNDFSKSKNVERVNIGRAAMFFANLFADTKGVSGIEAYSFGYCDQSVKDGFNAAMESIRDSEYEELVSTNSDGERTKVFAKVSGGAIRELVVINGGDDPAMVSIRGKIKPEDMQGAIGGNK